MPMFKSLESINVSTTNADEDKMSVELYNKLKSATARSLVRSIAWHLYESGDNSETLTKKLTAITNALMSGGDISSDADYLVRNLVAAVTSPRVAGSGQHSSTWDISVWSMSEDPYLFVYGEKNNFSDMEKEMVAEFTEARKRYESIYRKVIDYINNVYDQIRRDILVKHSTTLEQIAPTWLKEISSFLKLGLPIESRQNV